MITEEQLLNLLDDLRTGKYDNDKYEVRVKYDNKVSYIGINNQENKSNIWIGIYHHKSFWFLYKEWYRKVKPYAIVEKFVINSTGTVDNINISEETYENFTTYIKERVLQDKLITESNILSEYNL